MAADGRIAKKRKRPQAPPTGSRTASKPQKKQKTAARLDNLKWKNVSMPDRMDDYEGFFGLEEVDDVEIVKDEASGMIRYLATETQESTTHEDSTNEADDGEEWAGFGSDDDMKPATTVATDSQPKAKGAKSTKIVDKTKPTKSKQKSSAQNGTMAGFAALDNGDDSGVSVKSWAPLRLSPDTLASLSKLKFASPTPIQKAAIPEILAGHDVVGKASTGSGKTLAFGIPILERFLEIQAGSEVNKQANKAPLALILSPTRELAHQIDNHLKALCTTDFFQSPSIATLTGGLSIQKQERLLKDADIIVGTPGRLWEVISNGQGIMSSLAKIQFLVVDEADRLLSEGHFKEVEEILNSLDRQDETGEQDSEDKSETQPRQTLVFSATFDRGLQRKLAGKGRPGGDLMSNKESLEYLLSKLNFREEHPKFIDVNPVSQMASGLKEGLVECAAAEKDLFLYAILLLQPNIRTLVFTNSISAVRRLAPLLQNLNLPALALHSGMPQKARLRSIERFTQPKPNTSSILVATDVAARGLDIPNVDLVIHYHLPRAADTYVHRSGRTARANQTGSSILICGPEEVVGVRRLVAKVHAQAGNSDGKQFYIRTLDIDRRIVSRLKPRANLAKKLADTTIAKAKTSKEEEFMRAAAEELGVEYDSDEFEGQGKGRGRGGGRRKKEKETARGASKAEVGAMKAELKALLKQRVNVGVSERYLTSGGVDVDELLRQKEAVNGTGMEFLGNVQGLGMD